MRENWLKYIKIEGWSSKDTVKRMTRQRTGKNISNHISDKWLDSRICEDLSKLINKETTYEMLGKLLNYTLHQR